MMDVVFKDVNVVSGDSRILKDVCGAAKPGTLLAVMGPSGAGKTTLLHSVAGRTTLQSGEITLNGIPVSSKMKRQLCYVLQEDVFFSTLTLRETLTFTALVRLPDSMTVKEKMERMENLVDELDLKKCMDTVMGDMWLPGLSGGEKKRANIVCELITDPMMILLDEPTSGLDYTTAFSLMRTMKNYTAHNNKTVITTIHQPSSQIFFLFDSLLLLCQGHGVYFGSPRDVVEYFNNLGLKMAAHYNPADFILEKLKEGGETQEMVMQAAYQNRKTEEVNKDESFQLTKTTFEDDKETGEKSPFLRKFWKKHKSDMDEEANLNAGVVATKASSTKWATGFLTQYKQLTLRAFRQSKSRVLNKFKLFETIFLCTVLSLIWFQLPRKEETLRDRMGVIFYLSMHWGFTPLFDTVVAFPSEKIVINKERAAGWYRLSAYYLARMTSELPQMFIQPLLFVTIVYWTVGLNGVGAFFITIVTIFVHSIAGQSIGLFIGIACMDLRRSMSLGTVIILTIMLIGGFYTRHFPSWLFWIKYLAFLHYTFHALLYLEFRDGPSIQCASVTNSTESHFLSCSSTNSTTIPHQEILEYYGIGHSYWEYFLPLFAFIFVFRIAGYIVLRFIQKPH